MIGQKRKVKKLAKQYRIEMEARKAASSTPDADPNPGNEPESQENSSLYREAKYDEISRLMSLRTDIKDNLAWIILGFLLVMVEYLVVGIAFTLFSVIFFGIVVSVFTSKFYRVNSQPILYISAPPEKTSTIEMLFFPMKIMRHIDTVGLQNMVNSQYGPTLLIDDIEFEGNIPLRMKFSWVHFPEMQFILKKETYSIMVEYVNKQQILNFKLRSLLDLNSNAIANEMVIEKFRRINQARTEDASALHKSRQDLLKEIAESFHDLNVIEKKISTPVNPDEETENE